jgi:uncharacterized protein (TIGR03435 family)
MHVRRGTGVRSTLFGLGLGLCALGPASGQVPVRPAFEAATIKASKEEFGSSGWDSHPGSIVLRGQTLKSLIVIAYQIKNAQVSGGPKWLDVDRFDVNARAADGARTPQLLAMLQTLLGERFHLVAHHEERIVSAYELVTAKSGLKVRPAEAGKGSFDNYSRGRISAHAITMSKLADTLSRMVDRPVSDLTDTPGVFDFQLDWSTTGDALDSESELAAVLEQQAGLKLVGRKLPVDIMVVDQAERPTDN